MKIISLLAAIVISTVSIHAESSFEGAAGTQVPVYKKSIGNQWGYYEFLPESFSESSSGLGIVFYFNGANTGSGTGEI